ncbi:mitochondrial K+-H+ exchange-related-domain-containing protein [Kockovaella imperatae]|uniref:Mitochondrial K+-H+ exchange-related-domain-containing protein n=1 Tax=Kockovaella imperatae TaxID=4999 RepID=A0A1Y1UJT8_9TREE|nr:mitochondrial K+-H+ exchange-related-domain-containing protein [Kockovaella imperatae]ORX38330.1 mitochondrial K+-H+ exchange-related-domain-containing protein [Kockovaella imperatae]
MSAASKMPVPTPRQFRILALPLARLPRTASTTQIKPAPTDASSPTPPLSPHSVDGASESSGTSSHGEGSTASASSSSPPANTSHPSSSSTPLLFFHVIQPSPSPSQSPPPLTTRILSKASDTWIKLGEKDPKSWMHWFYRKGESLMDRIEYEEWALKAVHEGRGVKVLKEGEEKTKTQEIIEIPLLKPTLTEKGVQLPTMLPKLHRMLIHRIPYHRKMMIRSLLFTPVTFPFAIIPVIPNFPLFYVLWRAWSHYKAWRGAFYLERLLKLGMIKEQTSEELTKVYASKGQVVPEPGSENRAPDQTFSETSVSIKSSSTTTTSPDGTHEAQSTEKIPSQAKGAGPAPDGTSTPESMVFSPPQNSTDKPTTGSTPRPTPAPRHPSLLLSPSQVPLLAKTFDIKGQELMDVVRAVEQADGRAWAADKKRGGESQQGDAAQPSGSDDKKPGTNWRGNLHR